MSFLFIALFSLLYHDLRKKREIQLFISSAKVKKAIWSRYILQIAREEDLVTSELWALVRQGIVLK